MNNNEEILIDICNQNQHKYNCNEETRNFKSIIDIRNINANSPKHKGK